MKVNYRILSIVLVASFILTLTSCGPKIQRRHGASNKTGWYYNDPDWGGFEVVQYVEQQPGPDLVLIEGGTFTMGNTQDRVMDNWNAMRRRVTLSSYYMDQTEVSNLNYLEYLHWLRKVFVEYPEIIEKALPDTNVWRRPLAYNEPFVKYYLRHPAYQDYPVVGVSWVQANDYALWRTDRVNEKLLIDAGVLDVNPEQQGADNFTTDAYLAGQYEGATKEGFTDLEGNPRQVRFEDGIILPRYRLPTEAEWEYAALALIGNSETERISNYRMYPWDGHSLRNPDAQNRGLFMANFVRGRGDYMGVAGYLNDAGAPTVPVTSYWPNDYGLYCMAGNVNEWVLDVYRPMSFTDVEEFNPYRGNIFTTLAKDKEGNYLDKNDTTGHLYYRLVGTNKAVDPVTGRFEKNIDEITEDDVANETKRFNYTRADNRNYLDGDAQSSLGPDWLAEKPHDDETNDMYNYYGKDPKTHEGASSLINDEVRVYKGGGWRDRPYWLSPGTRRFLDQDMSRDDLGFRCAMIKVGSPTGH